MNKTNLAVVFLMTVGLMVFAAAAVASEVVLHCDDIEQIYVSKGTAYLAEGKSETFYGANVILHSGMLPLKEAYSNCTTGSIWIRIGDKTFTLSMADVSSGGNCFGIIRATPEEALDAAMSICPDKVKSYLDE
ncbi:MAG: hypothetical protein V3571_03980 [Pseudodesulfovibrio sp.]